MNVGVQQRQRIAAYGLARSGHEVLLVRVAETAGRPSTWWLPEGGLEFGETPEQCLTREFAEETGTSPQVVRLLGVVSDVGRLRNEPVELHSVRLLYEVEVQDRALRTEANGSTEQAKWVPVSHIETMHLVPWLRNWLSYLATLWQNDRELGRKWTALTAANEYVRCSCGGTNEALKNGHRDGPGRQVPGASCGSSA